MNYSFKIDEVPSPEVPSISDELRKAKLYLQRHNGESDDSLYDHLSKLLNKILSERPNNALDIFEEYSKNLKQERFINQADYLQNIYIPPLEYENAKKQIKIFEMSKVQEVEKHIKIVQEKEAEIDIKDAEINLMNLLYFIEQADVGLTRSEILILNLGIQHLIREAPIQNVRFWGKVLGNPKNYYVLEANLKKEEITNRQKKVTSREELEKKTGNTEGTEINTQYESTDTEALEESVTEILTKAKSVESKRKLLLSDLPKNVWQPFVQIPPEPIGMGLNQKVYFVCNSPGIDKWIELPIVTPQQIVASRSITRAFTGDLKTEIFSFPLFPGNEANYLRSQIARITASTSISPVGYFKIKEGENENEEGIEKEQMSDGILTKNPDYDPYPVKELIDLSMSNWCHHSPIILKQGRIVPCNLNKSKVNNLVSVSCWTLTDHGMTPLPGVTTWRCLEYKPTKEFVDYNIEEEENVADVDENIKIFNNEESTPLLTPLSEDETSKFFTPWSSRQSSQFQQNISIAIVRSNVWPGAFTFALNKRLINLYVGFGNKKYANNFMPPLLPKVQDQYNIAPEVMETSDPSD
ncbi:radial spoke head protein 6 homolog A [Leptopilina heterotoma]|uniref:radial spoke head protein 6 homolog A n=1 Tax=Leptopilina heterotoma TaxID=63436 RepID=UPI001CA8B87F|nr:radial spoke head protein 6 homolog A [Leptopilina heterotoma]